MAVNFDAFLKWAESRFGKENILVQGSEIRINSLFEPGDSDHHLWCSPVGGKKKRKFGVYHCFKTDKKGSLVKLVQIVDSCDRIDALDTLEGNTSIRDLEVQLEALLAQQEEKKPEPVKNTLALPTGCLLISDLGTNNWWRKRAEPYLQSRKIPIDGLYICTEGREKNRIVIPYYDRKGSLIYWNARALGKSKSKYLGPHKSVGVGKEDVIFMAGPWPNPGDTLYVCEGELNAISLKVCELKAAACGGKNMGEKQAIMLTDYCIVLCLDRDKAGKSGTSKMTTMLSGVETVRGKGKLKVVVPPTGYNDWNDMLVALGPEMVHHYILKNQRSLDYSFPFGTHSGYIDTQIKV